VEQCVLIDRNIGKYIVFSEDELINALRKISSNKAKMVFCVSGSGQLEGVLTDGDVRRWLTSAQELSLDVSALKVANTDYVALREDAEHDEIEARFSERIAFIPLVDAQNHLVAIAWKDKIEVTIGDFVLDESSPAFLIAEIGNNHNGSLELAKELVDLAVEAGADCAKFQMRNLKSLYRTRARRTMPAPISAPSIRLTCSPASS
jgi:N-acetylneuraminate synthase